jgi:hypothetical protein
MVRAGPFRPDIIMTLDMTRFTPDPAQYRRRASRLGQYASLEPDPERKRLLLEEAMSWVALAENEELLRGPAPAVPQHRRRSVLDRA